MTASVLGAINARPAARGEAVHPVAHGHGDSNLTEVAPAADGRNFAERASAADDCDLVASARVRGSQLLPPDPRERENGWRQLGRHGAELCAFWVVIALLLALVAVLYFVPAHRRLDAQRQAFDEATERLQRVSEENARLAAEAASLDDPYYIERLLREEYHWVPAHWVDRNSRAIAPRHDAPGLAD